jgi:membrane associated rhomboid family serine protease
VLPLYAVDRPARRAVVTYGLIAVNFAIFFWEIAVTNGFDSCLTEKLFYNYGFVPYSMINGTQLSFVCANPPYLTGAYSPTAYFSLLSSMFLHAGWAHIIGNMLFLFVFGPNIEARFGRVKYLAMYLGSGLAGSVATLIVALYTGSTDLYAPAVGASAAISGVLAAYLVLLPRSRVLAIIGYFLLPVAAFWFIGLWFVLQVLFQFGGIDTGVAYVAHIGGFALGIALALILKATRAPEPGYDLQPDYDL